MKLERINENQIRCTLNKTDLIDRELKLSELAYGTEKAKDLFRDMMAQASDELGFEADDIPLIIEAIPVSGDCIILIVTKVEDPEELDTRFARFSPADMDEDDEDFEESDEALTESEEYTGADEILDLFKQLKKNILSDFKNMESPKSREASDTKAAISEQTTADGNDASAKTDDVNIIRIFSFISLSEVTQLAEVLKDNMPQTSTLYKHPQNGTYYLVMEKGTLPPETFNKICNIATEYGHREKFTYATKAYFDEHYEKIIKDRALEILSTI